MDSVFLVRMNSASFVSLKFTKTKHLVCRARINGFNASLLVDTGASNSCIHSDLQKLFQLTPKGDSFDAAGASEGKMTATMTQKCELHLGRHKLGKHAFLLLDLNHVNQTLRTQRGKTNRWYTRRRFFNEEENRNRLWKKEVNPIVLMPFWHPHPSVYLMDLQVLLLQLPKTLPTLFHQ